MSSTNQAEREQGRRRDPLEPDHRTDLGNARRLVAAHGENTLYQLPDGPYLTWGRHAVRRRCWRGPARAVGARDDLRDARRRDLSDRGRNRQEKLVLIDEAFHRGQPAWVLQGTATHEIFHVVHQREAEAGSMHGPRFTDSLARAQNYVCSLLG